MSVYVEKIFGMFGRQSGQSSVSKTDNSAGTTTGGSIDLEPVSVWEAANALEAQIIIGRLKSENIPAITQGEALGAIYGFTSGGLAKTEVLVPAPLAEKAISLLETEYIVEDAATEEETENSVDIDTVDIDTTDTDTEDF